MHRNRQQNHALRLARIMVRDRFRHCASHTSGSKVGRESDVCKYKGGGFLLVFSCATPRLNVRVANDAHNKQGGIVPVEPGYPVRCFQTMSQAPPTGWVPFDGMK